MGKNLLYIQSNEFDFLNEPIAIESSKLIKKGWKQYLIAKLERPINIWYQEKLMSYSTVLLKPRYYFSSMNNLLNKTVVVNIASFDNKDINNFKLKDLELICHADLISEVSE